MLYVLLPSPHDLCFFLVTLANSLYVVPACSSECSSIVAVLSSTQAYRDCHCSGRANINCCHLSHKISEKGCNPTEILASWSPLWTVKKVQVYFSGRNARTYSHLQLQANSPKIDRPDLRTALRTGKRWAHLHCSLAHSYKATGPTTENQLDGDLAESGN